MRRLFSRKARREPLVIGQELAAARDAERKRLEAARGDQSPMPRSSYDLWRGELNLARPKRLSIDDELAEFVRRLHGVDAKERDNHALLGIGEERLFCLTVARSFVQGVKAFETPASLARFGPGIQSVLKRHTAGEA